MATDVLEPADGVPAVPAVPDVPDVPDDGHGEPRRVSLIDVPATQVRRITDLVGVVGCLIGVLVLLAFVIHAQGTTLALTRDVGAAAEEALPTLLQLPVTVFGRLVTLLAPLAVVAELAVRRTWRTLGAVLVAFVIATVTADLAHWLLTQWGTPQMLAGMTMTTIGFTVTAMDTSVAALVAVLTAAGTASRSTVLRTSWSLVWFVIALTVTGGQAAPIGTLFTLLVGRGVGLAIRYATGVFVDRSTGIDLVKAIRRAGVDVGSVIRLDPPPADDALRAVSVTTSAPVGHTERAHEPRRPIGVPDVSRETSPVTRDLLEPDPSVDVAAVVQAARAASVTPTGRETLYRRYAAADVEGKVRDVVVLDADRQVVGLLQAIWERFWRRGEARRPVSGVDDAADRLALLSLAARDAGVRTASLLGVARSRHSAVLVFAEDSGLRSIDALTPGELDDSLLDDVWKQLHIAHARGLAHLDVSAGSVLVDRSGRVWLDGWFEGQIGSPEMSRRIDLAQALALLGVLVGPQRALASATRCLTEDQLGAIAPLLQPPAIPAATRRAGDGVKPLLGELRDALVGLVPTADVKPVQLTRFSVRSVVTATILVAAVWTLLTTMNFAEVSAAVRGASLWWVLVAFGIQLSSYWGGALSLVAYTPEKIGVWRATEVHLASSVVDLVAPAAIGSATVNLRFLNRCGVSTPLGVATVALVQISQFVTTVVLLILVALGTGVAFPSALPSRGPLLAVVALLLLLLGALLGVRRVRVWVWAKLGPTFEQAWPRLTWLFANPRRMIVGILGNVVMTASYIGAFAAALAAFGGSVPLTTLAITYLLSNSAGSVIPSPGGIGPVEAALTGGLTVAGIPAAVALSVALVYRLVTFWINVPIGWIFFRKLQHQGWL